MKKLVLTIILSCLSFLNASNLQKTSVQLNWFDQFQFAGFYTAIEKGFYYDVDFGAHSISDADFKKIEDRVLEIAREKHEFKMRPVSKAEALSIYKDNEYKTELISNLEDGTITFCDHSNFFDLCRGGHIPNTSIIKAMKILSVAGAYWRGDEKNKCRT